MKAKEFAFPVPAQRAYPGLTVRDYFAAKALPALVDYYGAGTELNPGQNEKAAAGAYAIADAMLAEREKE